MNRITICKTIIQFIKNYITDTSKLEPHRAKNRFIRSRKLSMLHVIMYLFYSSKASMYQNLSSIREDLPQLDFPSVSKQALSKARQFISPDLFKELFYLSVDLFYKHIPARKLWHGLHLFAVDGSKLELPNSPSNFDFFGKLFGHPDPNRQFSMALSSIIYDVLDDYIVHASLHHYLASERSAAIEHLKILKDLGIFHNSIVIFDRGYYSQDLFCHCASQGHLCLMRLKDNFKISKNCSGDSLSIISGITVRVIEVILDNGSKEYLATNLLDSSFTPDMFRELYFYRWPVETKYKELKSRLAIEDFNGATSVSVFQEFYISMLLSNLSSLIKNDVDQQLRISSKSSNKHRYQANSSYIIGRMKKIFPQILSCKTSLSSIDSLFLDACRCRSQILPGRSFRRKKNKAKGRTHFRNLKVSF